MGLEDPVEFWKQFVDSTRKSDEEAQISKLGVTERSVEYNLNKNRFKKNLVSVPKIPVTQFKAGPHNFFTIGIGRDIRGEKQFRRKMLKLGNNVTYYGADPIPYINGELYSQIGTYFPLAIGEKSGISNARVMEKCEILVVNKQNHWY
ncbi:unnamed protein product [Caenorhabditis nigoni]